jgi:polyribonucleotide nucleotidyltransferase
MKKHTMKINVGEEEFVFETGKIGRQANGAVLVRAGETIVFSTACASFQPVENGDFLPLRVDYQEKFSSAGKTLGGFIKREGRPTERETLLSRLIDRPIRPMFEEGYFNETQVLSYVWSYDGVNSPEPLAICGASAALTISDIPLIKPIAGVRVGRVKGQFILNPTVQHQKESDLDLLIAGTEDAVLMIEGYCDFLTEEQVLEAIEIGHSGIKTICEALHDWQKKIGKPKNRTTLVEMPKDVINAVDKIASPRLETALKIADKGEREEAQKEIHAKVHEQLCPKGEEPKYNPAYVTAALKKVSAKHMRKMILNEKKRSDGRSPTDIRSIDIEQGMLPRVHGSSLFTRGETQALAVCTLGGESMAQRFEDLEGEGARRFYLQYFFPPFSVGEVGRMGPAGRREVGHGKLAERALQATLPSKESFPYTIRLESNITESNGSSSMASVCGGCLALMDSGVPIKRPVSGIAMGLILEGDDYIILSDILGIEDALGDMDFKITGDKEGITAFQMDIKVEGITIDIMRAALAQAKEGRLHILTKMLEVCPGPKSEISTYAPRIETLKIKPSKIATVIGPGGKQIRAIIEETGVDINIEDDGTICLTSPNFASIERAKAIIEGLTADVEIGKTYTGKITSIAPFGLFVEILPGKEGLCHISEFDTMRINDLNEHVKAGDTISVKVLDINERGQLKLSRKALLTKKD